MQLNDASEAFIHLRKTSKKFREIESKTRAPGYTIQNSPDNTHPGWIFIIRNGGKSLKFVVGEDGTIEETTV